jgi:periplasmic copper chaperone A
MSFIRNAVIAASLAVIVIAGLAPFASANDYRHGDLRITSPWTRATAPSARVGAGYLVIENTGAEPDRLVSATFASAAAVEIHEMAVVQGVMRMRELSRGIDIPARGKVELKPGGLHLMFMNLVDGLKEGGGIKGTLVFEKAGRVEVTFRVEGMGARSGGGHGHHGHGAHAPKTH